jgi:CBS domain-containing protein
MIITSEVQDRVASIDERNSALDAAIMMTERYIGSLVVTGKGSVKGLFTERDLMMNVIGEKLDPAAVKLADVISKNLVKVAPDEECSLCLDLMKKNRCRHLVVFDGEQFVGIISLRDMVALMLSEKEEFINRLKEYISG